MIRLVLNADDLGLAAPLSGAVVALLQAGHLSDASVLASGEAFPEAVRLLSSAGITGVGLHLCLVGGERPVCPAGDVPSLLAGGLFRRSWPSVAAATAARRIRIAEVEKEWEAQLRKVVEAGLRVTHLDSHQHLHLLPALLPVAARLARGHGIPFIRAPWGRASLAASLPFAARAKGRLLSALGRRARKVIRASGLPEPPPAVGLAEAGRMTLDRWAALLGSLPEGDYEAVVHPGADDEETGARYRWGYRWEEETRVLRSDELASLLTCAGAKKVSFADLSA